MRLRFKIENMFCAACSAACERTLKALPGVSEAQVNLATESAWAEYDEALLTPQAIFAAIEKAGYRPVMANVQRREREARQAKERLLQRRRTISALILAALLFLIAMLPMQQKLPCPAFLMPDKHPMASGLTQLVLSTVILILCREMLIRGAKKLFTFAPNMDSLVFVGSVSAWLFSLSQCVWLLLSHTESVHHLYFESAGMICALVMLGKTLEQRSKKATGSAVESLLSLTPQTVVIRSEQGEKQIDLQELKPGMEVIIHPGERIPCDGTVIQGETSLDESMLTGESLPVEKGPGATVYAGTMNTTGSITLRATETGQDTALSRIIEMVEEAQGSKAPIARFADKVAGIFVPVVMSIALISAGLWWAFGPSFEQALTVFISVMVVACPCAMGLATPTAIIVGMGRGAKQGIFFRNAENLERVHQCNVMLMDKTGTLTTGQLSITDFRSFQADEQALLTLAASAESKSEHPISKAVCAYAQQRGISPVPISSFEAESGWGIRATVENQKLLIGSRAMMERYGISVGAEAQDFISKVQPGSGMIFIAANGRLAGLMTVADTLREDTPKAIRQLKKMNIQPVMVTGDQEVTAKQFARQAGIEQIFSGVLPQDKAGIVEKFNQQGKHTVMIGDGINDAVALSCAETGIAIGAGADAAIQAADIILRGNSIQDAVTAIRLSKATMRVIKQNLFWAFFYNAIGIPIAAGLLAVFGGPWLPPMFAAAAMSISSLTVVSNALRLNKINIDA